MKFQTDGDTVTVETGAEDKQLAHALSNVVSGTVELANAIGVQTCEWCDEKGKLRPYQLTVDGDFQVLDICADCQRDFVEDAAQEAKTGGERIETSDDLAELIDDNPANLPADVDIEDLHD